MTTHDLPTAAGVWTGADLAEMEASGRPVNRRAELGVRRRLQRLAGVGDGDPASLVVERAYAALARAPSRLVVATLDDASLAERRPNLPGDVDRPNWSIPLPRTLEQLRRDPLPRRIAAALNAPRLSDGVRLGCRPARRHRRCGGTRGGHRLARVVADQGDSGGERQIEREAAHLHEHPLGERLSGGDPALADEDQGSAVVEHADRLVGPRVRHHQRRVAAARRLRNRRVDDERAAGAVRSDLAGLAVELGERDLPGQERQRARLAHRGDGRHAREIGAHAPTRKMCSSSASAAWRSRCGAAAGIAPAQQRLDRLDEIPSSERLAERADAGGRRPAVADGAGHEADRDRLECGVVEDCPGEADAVHVGEDAVDEDHRGWGARGARPSPPRRCAHRAPRWPPLSQGEGQESADGVIVLDDENGRNASFDHGGWIITGTPECTRLISALFHRPVTVCDRR